MNNERNKERKTKAIEGREGVRKRESKIQRNREKKHKEE